MGSQAVLDEVTLELDTFLVKMSRDGNDNRGSKGRYGAKSRWLCLKAQIEIIPKTIEYTKGKPVVGI